jgi:sugar phosphate permease
MAGGSSASAATKEAATEFHKHSPGTVYFYLGALILAYFAKYFCTSFLYVVQALWMKDQHIGKPSIQTMFICGYGMSMIGKRAAGKWCDAWGGKNVQMLSLGAYIPCVILFSFGGRFCEAVGIENHFPVFFSLWMFNGFFALGLSWVAIMVCASNWMPAHMEGRLLAIVGCAPELGDASARLYLGPIIKHGWGGLTVLGFGAAGDWSTVALSAALAAVLLSAPMFIFVKESPLGYEEEKKAELKKAGGGQLDATLMTLTCTMCGLLYAVRTMFLLDSVLWLNTVYCTHYEPNTATQTCADDPATVGNVASASLLFTFFGMFSVLLSGYAKDNLPKTQRGYILLVNSVLLLAVVTLMFLYDTAMPFPVAAFLVGMVGFADFGPYKTMSGAFAVDIGGKQRKGDVSAWMGVASNGSAAIILMISGFVPNWVDMFKILMVLSSGCILMSMLIIQYDVKKYGGAASAREPFLMCE